MKFLAAGFFLWHGQKWLPRVLLQAEFGDQPSAGYFYETIFEFDWGMRCCVEIRGRNIVLRTTAY